MSRLLVLPLLLALTACLSSGPTPPPVPHFLAVWITTEGNPVVGASVVATPSLPLAPTNSDGWTGAPVPAGPYRLTITAPGFDPAVTDTTVRAHTDVFVTLTRLAPPRPKQIRGRLQASARALTYPDGAPFQWRFATGFRLLELVATGREAEAIAFLGWARDTGFNGVRVLGSLCCWFTLTPEQAQDALPRLLTLAAEHDLYVELVALAGTRDSGLTESAARAYVTALGQLAAQHPHLILQLANEYWHPTQADYVQSLASLTSMLALVPAGVPVSVGAPADDEAPEPSTGTYLTRHLDRGRPGFDMARRVRELLAVSEGTGKPVVNDEPLGAGEVAQPGRRETNPDIFFVLGLLNRGFGIGGTFHFEDGLHAQVPRPQQQACAEAYLAGYTLLEDGLRYLNTGHGGSPTVSANFEQVTRVYSFVRGGTGYTVAFGIRGPPAIVWAWPTRALLVDRGTVQVWKVTQ